MHVVRNLGILYRPPRTTSVFLIYPGYCLLEFSARHEGRALSVRREGQRREAWLTHHSPAVAVEVASV
jgi:hypothetical protein